ncbi:FprA family A-type flavoprotein [Desulfohalovibrio reitneri]|uniref:FprA family A-type flavoprotein n=1 Tax=Desulfohalovibrio reitneri TaxID=1307759 RepID=UPI0004A74DF5|nr:flavodoxin domain-containing protein [Desulfohalovibrio reitneri]
MRPVEIKPGVFWVGAVDWESYDFHGYAISPRGTTYNAYCLKGDKITVFDTVKESHKDEYFCNVANVAGGLENVDYMVVNHLEPDHSGCLVEAVERMKPEKIYVSKMGVKSLARIHHKGKEDWPIEVCESGTEVDLGGHTMQFLETRMLHWPDNMATYLPGSKLLISSDAFGQNWATSERFVDEVDRPTLEHLLGEYFANIVQPYSPIVIKTLDKLAELNLDVDMIAPDHGLIYRTKEDCAWVMDRYREYATAKPTKRALIIYDTMWYATEQMAHSIADGLKEEGVDVRVMHLKQHHHSTVMTELLRSGAVCMGSPTHNNGILPSVAGMMQYMKGLKPQNKVAGVFGSFGWSGESVKVLREWAESMNMDVVDDPVKVQYQPTHDDAKTCFEYGKKIAQSLKEKIAGFEG